MEVVKAEILWTRTCPFNCKYCAMADGRKNTVSLLNWKKGIDNLKNLGCGFIAFYGAEPLSDNLLKLVKVIKYAEKRGINTTVITAMVKPKDFVLHELLYHVGDLRSLSVSFDIHNKPNMLKNYQALEALKNFQSLGEYRDVAAIVTLNRENFRALPYAIDTLTKMGIWTFFDLIHWNRSQPGSKCATINFMNDLVFQSVDYHDLLEVLRTVRDMKNAGSLCHTSNGFLDYLERGGLLEYDWNCAVDDSFPSWVTVDCDGHVYPCDDFQIRPDPYDITIDTLFKNWGKFISFWKPKVQELCPGCSWNTHYQAHEIKKGEEPFSNYVHTT